jgi:hypothetical protein
MNLSKPATGPLPRDPLSRKPFRLCPYCKLRHETGDTLIEWYNVSAQNGVRTRWTKCESCHAMWREEYDVVAHVFNFAGHWRPEQ